MNDKTAHATLYKKSKYSPREEKRLLLCNIAKITLLPSATGVIFENIKPGAGAYHIFASKGL